MLAMVNMDLGNLQSVLEAFRRVGAEVSVTARADEIERAAAVILPGVGAFGDGMESLRRKGLVEPLRAHALERNKPLFGICLGMQLLADEGEEHGLHQGLGLLRGRAVRLKPSGRADRIPNMGWCDARIVKPGSVLLENVRDGESFYFAHSYHVECRTPDDVAATIEYGGDRVVAAIERGNLFGVQFHPEKSQEAGLNLLQSFCKHMQRISAG